MAQYLHTSQRTELVTDFFLFILADSEHCSVKGNMIFFCEYMRFGIQFFRETDGFGNIGSCKFLVNSEYGIYLWLFFKV